MMHRSNRKGTPVSQSKREEGDEVGQQVLNKTIEEVGAELNAGLIGYVMEETLKGINDDLTVNLNDILKILTYLSGLYYSDSQRRYAEAELFRLQQVRYELETSFANALAIAPDLHRPVSVNT